MLTNSMSSRSQRLSSFDRSPLGADQDSLPQRSRLGRRIRLVTLGIALVDALLLTAAVVLAWELRLEVPFGLPPSDPGLELASQAGPPIVAAWLLFLYLRGAYSRRAFGAGTEEYRGVVVASLSAAGAVGMFCYLIHTELSRGFVFLTFVIGTPALLLWRYVARQGVHASRLRGHLTRRVLAVGGCSGVSEVMEVLRRERNLGFDVVGVCMPPGNDHGDLPLDVPDLGPVTATREACDEVQADTVLVTRGGYESSADLRRIAWDLQGSRIDLIVVPSLTEVAGPRIHMRPVAGLPLLHLEEPQGDKAGGPSKRLFDIVGGVVALVLLSPLMLAVALAIKAHDGGEVLFRQRRVGWNGKAFDCYKFRSMCIDAPALEKRLRVADGHSGALWKSRSDPRVTRVGRFIRRYSVDELPQLLNVIRGDMSLVGPRPQQSWEVETYSDSARRRLLVRPGMTGLWQVSGRSRLSFEEAVRLDLFYVDNWSLTTDLVIMAKTVKAVVSSDGAY